MATGEVHVSVVDVGQGQCTFVEIYDTTGKLTQALLFDCGSDKLSTETQTNLKYIAEKVSSMDTPAFDCIVFSHSDKDHVYLMYDLLKKFDSKPEIKEVWYGGYRPQYTKYGHNILDDLQSDYGVSDDQMKSPIAGDTGYDKKAKRYTKHFWESPDKKVRIIPIKSNVISDDPDIDIGGDITARSTAESKNRVSIVCGLYYAGSSYVICGDATSKTMAAINSLFSDGTTVFDSNLMLTIPHHGSRATGFAVPSSRDASDAAIEIVDTFSGIMKANSVSVSAYEKHRHPSLELMEHFIPTLKTPILRDPRLNEINAHRLTAYNDINLRNNKGKTFSCNEVYSFDNQDNVFTTRYSGSYSAGSYNLGATRVKASQGTNGDDIDEFASWKYKTQTNGSFLLGGYLNLNSASFTVASLSVGKEGETAINVMIGESKKEQVKFVKIKTVRKKRTSKKTYYPITNRNRFGNRVKQYH